MNLSLSDDRKAAVEGLLFAGQKIEAIRVYRQATGLGLREAKEAVDAIEQTLRDAAPEKFAPRPQGKGCFGTAAVMCIAGIAVGYWMLVQLSR